MIVRQEAEEVHIDMYIIVSYGTKISRIAHNVQSKVKYTLDKTVGLAVDSVKIFLYKGSRNEPVVREDSCRRLHLWMENLCRNGASGGKSFVCECTAS